MSVPAPPQARKKKSRAPPRPPARAGVGDTRHLPRWAPRRPPPHPRRRRHRVRAALSRTHTHTHACARERDPVRPTTTHHPIFFFFGLPPPHMASYYDVLGVPPTASQDAITAAFRARALESHPDVAGPESAPDFRALADAYAVLRDPASWRTRGAPGPGGGAGAGGGGRRRGRRDGVLRREWRERPGRPHPPPPGRRRALGPAPARRRGRPAPAHPHRPRRHRPHTVQRHPPGGRGPQNPAPGRARAHRLARRPAPADLDGQPGGGGWGGRGAGGSCWRGSTAGVAAGCGGEWGWGPGAAAVPAGAAPRGVMEENGGGDTFFFVLFVARFC